MGRHKKIIETVSDSQNEDAQETPDQITIMPIAELLKLTPEQQQLFRANGGTTTEN